MKCSKCGYEIKTVSVECPSCGTVLAKTRTDFSEKNEKLQRKLKAGRVLTKRRTDRFGEEKPEVSGFDMNRIVKTKIVDSSHLSSVVSSHQSNGGVGRALVGGALFGSIGAVIGAATAGSKTTYTTKETHDTTFLLYYANGSTWVRTVSNDSPEYEEYIRKLEP